MVCFQVFVTTAGVTRMCADVSGARQRWRDAAARLHSAVRALLGDALDDDDDGDSRIKFDAAVFVAATEDLRSSATSPLTHARAAFRANHWALDDDCQVARAPSARLRRPR